MSTAASERDLVEQLAADAIGPEQFLWAAREAGIDRRDAARLMVSAAATETPGSRAVGPAATPASRPADLDIGTSHVQRADAAQDAAAAALRIGLWLPVDGMDPAVATYRTSRLVTEQLYSTLMALDPKGRPYPDLAEWVEVSDDGLAYTFGLVPGVLFHDGSPVTAEDVTFTIRRLLEMGEAYHFDPWVATIAGADTIDPLTVRIRLTQPTGPILTWLAFCGTGVVPRAAVEAGRSLDREPIGSGPFRLAEPWAGGDAAIRLSRHDNSARGGSRFGPRLAGLEFQAIVNDGERADALLAGGIDLDALLVPTAWQRVSATDGLVAHDTPDSRWHWLVVNCRRAPLGDARVRRAIALALDRRALIDDGFEGHGLPLGAGVIAPWSWASAAQLGGFRDRPDPEAARTLLDAAGAAGSHIDITAADHLGIAIRQAELIAGQLEAVGLDARVRIVDGATYAKEVSRAGDFQLATSYWGSPIWDPDDFVYMGFRSGARYDAGSCSTPAIDARMDEGRSSLDRQTRRRAYVDLQALALAQLPVIPTIQPGMLRGTTTRLRGYVPTPNAQLRTLRDAWLTSEARPT